ncbi:MAG TPA: hypothetical protein VF620_14930 [Allosphingosinicella sp.]
MIIERRRREWHRRHRRMRHAMLLILVGGAGALLFVLMTEILSRYFGVSPARRFLTATIGDLPLVGNTTELDPDSVRRLVERYDLPVSAALGWILAVVGGGLIRGNSIAKYLTRRLYRPYNAWALPPIGKPRAHDGVSDALRWREPSGARLLSWQAILGSIRRGSAAPTESGRGPWRKSHAELPFAWSLILGRPGAGKSRMAMEIARLLGHRALLSTATRDERWARWRLRSGEWLRRRLPFLLLRPDDPWDAGLLDTAHFNQQMDALEDWAPRRPSLLWLDDPAPTIASRCLELLERRAAAGDFQHPVRLIISNQSFPIDLARGSRTTYHGEVTLSSSAFTPADIRALAPVLGSRSTKLYKRQDLHFFMEVTQGNPLLVELAFDWLREGKRLRDLDQRLLLEARIERIREALSSADFPVGDMEAMRALACLTLAGPGCPIDPVNSAFGNRLPPRAILETAFPVEAARGVDLSRIGPSIRPDLIGDAFVRSVIAEQTPETAARRISEVAFQARPEGWLRAVERIEGGSDLLASVLAREPEIDPSDSATKILLAQALLRQALNGRRDIAITVELVAAQIRSSSSAAHVITSIWQWFTDVVEQDWRERVEHRIAEPNPKPLKHREPLEHLEDSYHRLIHGRPMLLLGVALLQLRAQHCRDPDTDAVLRHLDWLDDAVDLIRRADRVGIFGLEREGLELLGRCLTPPADLGICVAHVHHPRIRARRLAASDRIPVSVSEEITQSLVRFLTPFDTATPPLAQTYIDLQISLVDGTIETSAAKEALERAEGAELTLGSPVDPLIGFTRMRCWAMMAAYQAADGDFEGSRGAIAKLDAIEMSSDVTMRRRLTVFRLQARIGLIGAIRTDTDHCTAIAQEAEAIASDPEWDSDAAIQIIRAQCWQHVVLADGTPPDLQAEAVDRLRRIALAPSFRPDRLFQVQYLNSLHACFDENSSFSAYEAAVDEIERLAAEPSYADDVEIQRIYASALQALALLAREDPPNCASIVNRLRQLAEASGASSEPEIQLALLHGLDSLSHAWRSDAAVAREAAAIAERVAKQPAYLSRADFQRLRTKIWERAARVRGMEHREHLAAFRKVESLASMPILAADRDAQLYRAMAWQSFTYSQLASPSACRDACDKVEAITGARRYRRDEDMQGVRAEAWKYVGYSTRGIDGCEAAVLKVEQIAAPFPDSDFIQGARAQAWRDLAMSFILNGRPYAQCLARLEAIVAAARPEWSCYNDVHEFARQARGWTSNRGLLADPPRRPDQGPPETGTRGGGEM